MRSVYKNQIKAKQDTCNQYTTDSSSIVVLCSKAGEPNNNAKYMQVYVLHQENWLSLGSDSVEIEVATAAKHCIGLMLINMLAKFSPGN